MSCGAGPGGSAVGTWATIVPKSTGARNAVPGELLVRVTINRATGAVDLAE